MEFLIKACANGNLGDDLFIISILERYVKHTKNQFDILVYQVEKYKFLEEHYNNVKILKYPVPSKIKRVFVRLKKNRNQKNELQMKYYRDAYRKLLKKEYDCFINVGGSLMYEYEGEEFVISNWIEEFIIANIKAKKKYMLNINMQTLISTEFAETCTKILTQYDDVCFRDLHSYNLFKNRIRCRVAPDMVLSLQSVFADKYKDIKEEKALGINIINFYKNKRLCNQMRKYIDNYEKTIIEVATCYLKRGYQIKLFGFDDGKEERKYLQEIMRKIISQDMEYYEKVGVYSYSLPNIWKFIEEIAKCESVVTTRFHAVIICILLGKVFYPIVYEEKISNFLEYINYKGEMSMLSQIQPIEEIIRELNNKTNCIPNNLALDGDVFSILDLDMKGDTLK